MVSLEQFGTVWPCLNWSVWKGFEQPGLGLNCPQALPPGTSGALLPLPPPPDRADLEPAPEPPRSVSPRSSERAWREFAEPPPPVRNQGRHCHSTLPLTVIP